MVVVASGVAGQFAEVAWQVELKFRSHYQRAMRAAVMHPSSPPLA
jgi:hypothetical protein